MASTDKARIVAPYALLRGRGLRSPRKRVHRRCGGGQAGSAPGDPLAHLLGLVAVLALGAATGWLMTMPVGPWPGQAATGLKALPAAQVSPAPRADLAVQPLRPMGE